MKRFCYYQPNAMDHRDMFGDCQIRALSKALNCTWMEAFDKAVRICRTEQASMLFSVPVTIRNRMLDKLGFDYHGISNKKGSERPTVASFAKDHPTGTYICCVANHVVAVVNGRYYDTWDCGWRCLYGYFELRPTTHSA